MPVSDAREEVRSYPASSRRHASRTVRLVLAIASLAGCAGKSDGNGTSAAPAAAGTTGRTDGGLAGAGGGGSVAGMAPTAGSASGGGAGQPQDAATPAGAQDALPLSRDAGADAKPAAPCASRETRLRADGVFLADCAPFYPMGAYLSGASSGNVDAIIADLTTLAQAGFNAASLEFQFDATGRYDRVLDAAARLGMRIVVENAVDTNGSAAAVTRYRDKLAVLAWNIGDDLHRKYTVAQTRTMHEAVKRADPMRPDIGIVYNPNLWRDFFVSDVMGIYKYPVADIADNGGSAAGEGPIGTVDQWLTSARMLGKPLIGIPQGYAWPNDRFPTPAELRNMAFQMVVNNVRGVVWYAFGRSGSFLGPHRPAEWQEAQTIAADVRSIQRHLTEGDYQRVAAGNDELRAASWRIGSEMIVIVANTGANATASITVPAGAESVQPLFAGRRTGFTLAAGKLTGTIDARDVHGYRVSLR